MFAPAVHESIAEVERLGQEICEAAAHLEAARARWLSLVAEFDRRQGGLVEGCRSTAHWLNWRCGVSMGEARQQVQVARVLEERPVVAEAFGRGEIGFAKARAIVRTTDVSADGELVELARHATAAQLEQVVREWRRAEAADDAEADRRRRARRSLTWGWDDDGSLVLRGRLCPDGGALVTNALEAARDQLRSSRTADGADDGPAAANADALVLLAEGHLANGAGERGGDERYQVVVHVRADADGTVAHLEGGPAVSLEAVRRYTCDSRILAVLEGAEGAPLDVTRRTRRVSGRLRRALQARDGRCRFPGCAARAFTEAHHTREWTKHHRTRLDELLLLCWWHHHVVHEGGWRVDPVDRHGRFVFRRPDGTLLEADPPRLRGDPDAPARANAAGGLRIDADTLVPAWDGARLDLDLAVGALCSRHPS